MNHLIPVKSVLDIVEAVRNLPRLRVIAGNSKDPDRASQPRPTQTHQTPGHQTQPHQTQPQQSLGDQSSGQVPPLLDISNFAGVLEYDPSEFTLTALPGTRISDIQQQLARNGQFIPFDPPLAEQGATLGGTIAAGIAGPTRLRFGGVRDFIIGIKMVDGTGALVTGGGKVVKNAAGFDTPKMMVGGWGELGVLTEVTLKVFPHPASYCTVCVRTGSLAAGIAAIHRLACSPIDLDALDLDAGGVVYARIGGLSQAILDSARRVRQLFDTPGDLIEPGADEQNVWSPLLEWTWQAPTDFLVRVPLTTSHIASLDAWLHAYQARRRYSVAGNVAWIGWPTEHPLPLLHEKLLSSKLSGRVLRRPSSLSESTLQPAEGASRDASWLTRTKLGWVPSELFAQKIKRALDPDHRFAERE